MSHIIMSEVFKPRDTPCINPRRTLQFSTNPIHSAYNGIESALHLEPKIWEQIPAEINIKESLDGIENEIEKWKPVECPCRICRIFVRNLLFI